jgi:CysZ protein
MRHVPQSEAKVLRQANRLTVFLGGLVIAGIASVPILNLITPLFATGFMVRVYKALAKSSGLRVAARARV